jgi:hypothetical protein
MINQGLSDLGMNLLRERQIGSKFPEIIDEKVNYSLSNPQNPRSAILSLRVPKPDRLSNVKNSSLSRLCCTDFSSFRNGPKRNPGLADGQHIPAEDLQEDYMGHHVPRGEGTNDQVPGSNGQQ